MELYEFGQFLKFDDALNFLANRLTLRETWDYSNPEKELAEGNNAARFKFPILRNYLEHTFRKIKAEDKIVYTPDKKYSCFHTGLVTENLEDIFCFFEANRFADPKSPYFFKAFIKKSDVDFLTHFSHNQPLTANYFHRPELLLFNPTYEIIPDVDHIIMDNIIRFPDPLKNASKMEIRKHLNGAIEEISKRVKINYKIAIPQFYDGKFQLLLPLYLVDNKVPDLAMVIEKINEKTYSARTCLTVGMAYNNARLIVCPHSEWLKP